MFKKIRFFGERSLSSLIYILIMAMLLFSGFVMFFSIMVFIFEGRKGLALATGELPLGGSFRLLLASSENMKIASDYIFKASIYQLPAIIVNFIRYYYIAIIFQNFSFNLIFTEENFKRLRDFGVLSIVFTALLNIANYFAGSELSKISVEGAKIISNNNIINGSYIVFIAIIIFAEAFKRAIIMKEEQELTV